jgi:hypothetical protein
MERSFELSLRPTTSVPPTVQAEQYKWSLQKAREQAQTNTRAMRIESDKTADLYFDDSIKLSEADEARIIAEIGKNKPTDREVRSVWFDLEQPIPVSDGSGPYDVTSVQIKGVVFDAREPLATYGGAGWPREYFFGGRNGFVCRFEAKKVTPVGYCFLEEAVNEFMMCRTLRQRLATAKTQVPFPIGWGHYRRPADSNREVGFVILGQPDLVPGRQQVYLDAVSELAKTGDFKPVGDILALNALMMREIHQAAATAAARHLGNFSLTRQGRPYAHDIGTPSSLTREDMYSDEQFIAETFGHLAFILTPRKIVVPVPGADGPYRETVMKHYDQIMQTVLGTYYDDPTLASEINLESFAEAFFAAQREPVVNLKLTPAATHAKVVGRWLKEYRRKHPQSAER